jgi:hypothetical protein
MLTACGMCAKHLTRHWLFIFDQWKIAGIIINYVLNRYSEAAAPVEREWVRDIWNTWFDEVFPPTPPAPTPMQPLSTSIHLASPVFTERNLLSVTDTNEADDQTGYRNECFLKSLFKAKYFPSRFATLFNVYINCNSFI